LAENQGSDFQREVTQKPVTFVPIGQIAGEKVLWKRDIKRGIIHKEVTVEERITNIRIFQYNVETQKLMSLIPLKMLPDVVIQNSRRSSQSTGSGVYSYGVYTGSRSGTSRTIGDVVIMKNGVIYTRLRNVVDPQGVKQLINRLKKEVAAAQKQAPLRLRAPGIVCKSCGTKLPPGSNFCNKCGSVQG
jgi:hypothetical protein